MSTELARRAAAGDLTPEVARWIADGLRKHRDGLALDQALGLDRASRIRERNAALLEAAALLAADDGTWACACRLEAAIRRFEARVRPLLQRDPTMTLAPLDQALRRAFETGARVPGTGRNIWEIIR